MPLFAKGELPPIMNFYEYTYPYKWDVAVLPDAPFKSYEDLKGKKIGVSDFGTTDYPVTRAVFKNIGIDPDKDVPGSRSAKASPRVSRSSAARSTRSPISTPASASSRPPA